MGKSVLEPPGPDLDLELRLAAPTIAPWLTKYSIYFRRERSKQSRSFASSKTRKRSFRINGSFPRPTKIQQIDLLWFKRKALNPRVTINGFRFWKGHQLWKSRPGCRVNYCCNATFWRCGRATCFEQNRKIPTSLQENFVLTNSSRHPITMSSASSLTFWNWQGGKGLQWKSRENTLKILRSNRRIEEMKSVP